MSHIKVEKNPDPKRLHELGVYDWSIWTKEASEFPWTYDSTEACYFIEGDVIVSTKDGEHVIKEGDYVEFPKGLDCTWKINKRVKKYYKFS